MTFREVRSAQQAEMARFGQASYGGPKHSVCSASSHTTPTHAAPRVPLLQRRITNPLSDQTPVPGPAPHPHPQGTPTDYPRLLLKGLPSGQTQARGLPLLLVEQAAAVRSPPPVVSARVRLPVQLLASQMGLLLGGLFGLNSFSFPSKPNKPLVTSRREVVLEAVASSINSRISEIQNRLEIPDWYLLTTFYT